MSVKRHVKVSRARKAAANNRVAVALAKFLKQANPAMKTAGAAIQRLKGGVLKITPIKANAGGGSVQATWHGHTMYFGSAATARKWKAALSKAYREDPDTAERAAYAGDQWRKVLGGRR